MGKIDENTTKYNKTQSVCIFSGIYCIANIHYSAVQRTSWRLQSVATRLFTQRFLQANIKEKNKALHLLTICEENPVRGIHR